MSADQKELKKIQNLPPTIQQIALAAFLARKFQKYDVLLTPEFNEEVPHIVF